MIDPSETDINIFQTGQFRTERKSMHAHKIPIQKQKTVSYKTVKIAIF